MVDDQTVLAAERLRDDLQGLRADLRSRYRKPESRVVSLAVKAQAARIAEAWIVHMSGRSDIQAAVNPEYLGDLTVHFQRLLTFTERSARRSQYDEEINAITRNFTLRFILPLKAARAAQPTLARAPAPDLFVPLAFVGHSFASEDADIANYIIATLEAAGITTTTGEAPRAGSVSDKVKAQIEANQIFVGIFTRRDKIAGKEEWTTSPWVIDEKAYALGRGKKLILIKEQGVGSIGGIQGDYEFIEFSRDALHMALVKLMRMFVLAPRALRS